MPRVNRAELLEPLAEVLISLAIGLLASSPLLALFGFNPLEYFKVLFTEGFSDPSYLLERATPLIATALAFAIPLYTGLFNIGAEGQLYLGALAALLASIYTGSPVPALIAAAAAGAALGLLVAALRVYRGVNEVVSTIMLNWTIYYVMLYLLTNYLYNPQVPHESLPVPPVARIGRIAAFMLAALLAAASYVIVYRSRLGYEMRITGYSFLTARYAGVEPRRVMINAMVIGAAIAGIGGALQVLGIRPSIDVMLSSLYGLGFEGIGVALLARLNPLAMIASALFLAGLYIGGQFAEAELGTPPQLTDATIGIIIIALAAPYAYRLVAWYLRNRLSGSVKAGRAALETGQTA